MIFHLLEFKNLTKLIISFFEVTLIDSHQHLNHGAVIAQTATAKLQNLCSWYYGLLQNCYGAHPECYELSYLYFKRYAASEMVSGQHKLLKLMKL